VVADFAAKIKMRGMSRHDLGLLALSIALTATAGYVDAIGFLKIGHLFVSFMSGDSTQLAVAVSHSDLSNAGSAGGIVALFVLGVMAGRLVTERMKPWNRAVVLVIEAALLGCAGLISGAGKAPIVLMAFAMGMQNAVVHKAGDAKMGLTYVTGALVSFGEKAADAFRTSDARERWAWVPYLLLWIGLVVGALCGAFGYQALGIEGLLVPAGALLIMAAVSAIFVWNGFKKINR
jgi:uncharacterized membrane protein YoaK (UPF0700 family)